MAQSEWRLFFAFALSFGHRLCPLAWLRLGQTRDCLSRHRQSFLHTVSTAHSLHCVQHTLQSMQRTQSACDGASKVWRLWSANFALAARDRARAFSSSAKGLCVCAAKMSIAELLQQQVID